MTCTRINGAKQAEPVRMTDDEIASELKLFPRASGLVIKIARAIETAVLRANGLLPAEDQNEKANES